MQQNLNKSGVFRSSVIMSLCPLVLCFFLWFCLFVFGLFLSFKSCINLYNVEFMFVN